MHKREQVERYLRTACPDRSVRGVVMLELLTGCSLCGRRLLEAGMHVRDGTAVITVLDADTEELVTQYVVCKEHVPCSQPS